MAFPGPNTEGQVMTLENVAPGTGSYFLPLYIALAQIVAADVINFPLTFKGRIESLSFSVQTKATTAAKAATLTAKIKSGSTTTALTGGVLSLTSANMTPEAAVVNATAITGLNKFNRGDSLVLTASAVTAFAEGTGYIMVEVTNDDTMDAMARNGAMFSVNP